MNTACLGLKFLIDSVSGREDVDSELLNTLEDVNNACDTAVEILNDLLTFEKLESGILVLHKSEEPAIKFVEDNVEMFALHARAKGVTLQLILRDEVNPLIRRGMDNYTQLTDRDVLNVDKFKMNQVIRNMISNALKFTPTQGTVTVEASYEECCL